MLLPKVFLETHEDLSAKYSGIVNGVSTTFGALAGVCSNAYVGYALKATDSNWAGWCTPCSTMPRRLIGTKKPTQPLTQPLTQPDKDMAEKHS